MTSRALVRKPIPTSLTQSVTEAGNCPTNARSNILFVGKHGRKQIRLWTEFDFQGFEASINLSPINTSALTFSCCPFTEGKEKPTKLTHPQQHCCLVAWCLLTSGRHLSRFHIENIMPIRPHVASGRPGRNILAPSSSLLTYTACS